MTEPLTKYDNIHITVNDYSCVYFLSKKLNFLADNFTCVCFYSREWLASLLYSANFEKADLNKKHNFKKY
jgi:hypothetical protein